MAWEVLTPADRTNAGVVTVQLASEDRRVITLVSHAIGLAPGSMVLDVEPTLTLRLLPLTSVAVMTDVPMLPPVSEPVSTHGEALVRV